MVVDCVGERIFRIGSVRYRMDPSGRTLHRISGGHQLIYFNHVTCYYILTFTFQAFLFSAFIIVL